MRELARWTILLDVNVEKIIVCSMIKWIGYVWFCREISLYVLLPLSFDFAF